MNKQYYAVQRTGEKKNKLIHADRKKHKYIYKKMVNGKMRYYYDVGPAGFDLGDNGIGPGKDGEPDSNIQGYTKLEDMLGKDEKDKYWRSQLKYKRTNEHIDYLKKSDLVDREKMIEKAYNELSREAPITKAAWEEYKKTPLGKLTQATKTINKGRDAVADMLDKLSSELRSYRKYDY